MAGLWWWWCLGGFGVDVERGVGLRVGDEGVGLRVGVESVGVGVERGVGLRIRDLGLVGGGVLVVEGDLGPGGGGVIVVEGDLAVLVPVREVPSGFFEGRFRLIGGHRLGLAVGKSCNGFVVFGRALSRRLVCYGGGGGGGKLVGGIELGKNIAKVLVEVRCEELPRHVVVCVRSGIAYP